MNLELKIELVKVWFELFQNVSVSKSQETENVSSSNSEEMLFEIIPHGSKVGRLNDWVKTGVGALAAVRSLNKISQPTVPRWWRGCESTILLLFRCGLNRIEVTSLQFWLFPKTFLAKVDFSTLMLQLHLLSEIQFFEKGSVKVFMFFASQMGLWGGWRLRRGLVRWH